MKKRLFSIFLSIILCISLLPIDAFAETIPGESSVGTIATEESVIESVPAEVTPEEEIVTEETPAEVASEEEVETEERPTVEPSEEQPSVEEVPEEASTEEMLTEEVPAEETVDTSMELLGSNETVYYLDKTGESFPCDEYTLVSETDTVWRNGWYVVDQDMTIGNPVQIGDGVKVEGNVSLLLKNEVTLTIYGGIQVGQGSSLTIYGQTKEDDMGHLKTYGSSDAAGISGDGTITINSGRVTAQGGFNGAGIGGRADGNGGNIVINGGIVKASGASGGAGIGGGINGNGGNVTINGGNVTAIGGTAAAGIGGGMNGNGGSLKILGDCVLNAQAGKNVSRAIGKGEGAGLSEGSVKLDNRIKLVNIDTNKTIYLSNLISQKAFSVRAEISIVKYLDSDADGNYVMRELSDDYNHVQADTRELTDGWYILDESQEMKESIVIKGNAKLILFNGSKLTAKAGIVVEGDYHLMIYGQSQDKNEMGVLEVTGAASNGVGLGGSGRVTIYSGRVSVNDVDAAASGAFKGAGISGKVTINGGEVIARGGENCAGIGGVMSGEAGTLMINGGTVEAHGGANAAAIGGGMNGAGADVTIGGPTENITVEAGANAPKAIGAGLVTNGAKVSDGSFKISSGMSLINNADGKTIWIGTIQKAKYISFAAAYTAIPYLKYDENGQVVDPMPTITEYGHVDKYSETLTAGWYVLDESVTLSHLLKISGDVTLILENGCTLTTYGIELLKGNHLTVYGQSEDDIEMGVIFIDALRNPAEGIGYAGIGGSKSSSGQVREGGTLTVNSGRVQALGGNDCPGIGGTVTINGGIVKAQGGDNNPGISGTVTINGGDVIANACSLYTSETTIFTDAGISGTVTINGGEVLAYSDNKGAGIGGTVTINGGKVTAGKINDIMDTPGAGISGTVTINGGEVTAKGGDNCAGIGGVKSGNSGTVTINGGTVTACGGDNAAAIGGGLNGAGADVTIGGPTENITVIAGKNAPKTIGAGLDQNDVGLSDGSFKAASGISLTNNADGKTIWINAIQNAGSISLAAAYTEVPYLEYDAFGYVVTPMHTVKEYGHVDKYSQTLTTGCYVLEENVYLSHTLKISGNVTLILENGCTLTTYGIELLSGNHLTVYGQSEDELEMGAIYASAWYGSTEEIGYAGIGGSKSLSGQTRAGGTLTVNSGRVQALGGNYCPGIGGTVTINGGIVKAQGGDNNPGISGTVTINGGDVLATAFCISTSTTYNDTGISGTVTINDGKVTATGGVNGAGISGTVTISGGEVTATGGDNGAGIGGGCNANGAKVTFTGDCVVHAKAGKNAPRAIGAGLDEKNVGLSGGSITATGITITNLENKKIIWNTLFCAKEISFETAVFYVPCYVYNEKEGKLELDGSCGTYDHVRDADTKLTGSGHWYVLDEDIEMDHSLTIEGDVHLILENECKMNVNGGILVNSGNSLTIYGQTGEPEDPEETEDIDKMGCLTASGINKKVAGIGGNNGGGQSGTVTINGGNITATGGTYAAGIGNRTTINGGIVTATGGEYNGAGIGSVVEETTQYKVVINGGKVTARGGAFAAGIGAVDNANGEVIINGGEVTATGGAGGAGIGGGDQGRCGSVIINGGEITATGGSCGAGIGQGSESKNSGKVTINGGLITAEGGISGAGIGGGQTSPGANITINGSCEIKAKAGRYAPRAIGAGEQSDGLSNGTMNIPADLAVMDNNTGKHITPPANSNNWINLITGTDISISCGVEVPYITYDENGNLKKTSADRYWYIGEEYETLTKGWYYLYKDLELNQTLTIEGDVHLILGNGCTLTTDYNIFVGKGSSLTIYAQSEKKDETGSIVVNNSVEFSDATYAGIGGSYSLNDGTRRDGGAITINGGIVDVQGQDECPGLGGNVTINGGYVTATAGLYAAGIGRGTATITGGNVTAQGGTYGAGIGSGMLGSGNSVTITGGSVTALGGESGAGIGGGWSGVGGKVIISGGEVKAEGGDGAAGIGDGMEGSGATVTIDGACTIKAKAGAGATRAIGVNRGESFPSDGCFALADGISLTKNSDGETIGVNALLKEREISFSAKKTYIPYYIYDVKTDDTSPDVVEIYNHVYESDEILTEGWYVLDEDITIDHSVMIEGEVHLLLVNHCTMKVNGSVQIPENSNLIIHGQSRAEAEVGQLLVDATQAGPGSDVAAGIHLLGTLNIEGGKIDATGYDYGAGIGGNAGENGGPVTVNSGLIKAVGGKYGAGIGGGWFGDGGILTVNSGKVEATGGFDGAGIGSGSAYKGMDIGGSSVYEDVYREHVDGGKLILNGGEIIAKGGDYAAGIGGGMFASGTDIQINNKCTLKVMPAEGTPHVIGAGYGPDDDTTNGTLQIADNISMLFTENKEFAPIDLLYGPDEISVTFDACPVPYLTYNEKTHAMEPAETATYKHLFQRIKAQKDKAITLESGWYIMDMGAEMEALHGIEVGGDVHLILGNGSKLTVKEGFEVDKGEGVWTTPGSLTIYSQTEAENDMGQLIAFGKSDQSAIGNATRTGTMGSVTINGGKIEATGGYWGAGIGGSYYTRRAGDMTINGGIVHAIGGEGAAGMGSAAIRSDLHGEKDSTITFNGGKITVEPGKNAAGVGGGEHRPGFDVHFNGGTLTAICDPNKGNTYTAGGGDSLGWSTTDEYQGTVTIPEGYVLFNLATNKPMYKDKWHTTWVSLMRAPNLSLTVVPDDTIKAKEVIDAIKAIDLSKASETELKAVQSAYDQLTAAQKALVDADPAAKTAKTAIDTKVTELEKAAAKTSVAAVQKKILAQKSDKNIAGSVFGKLKARLYRAAKTSLTIKWNKVSGATGYVVYIAKCGGKAALKKVKTTSAKATSYKCTKLKKGTAYKAVVMAVKKDKVLSISKTLHAFTKGSKITNAKALSLNKTKVTIKKGKTFRVRVKKTSKFISKYKLRKHRAISYESSNKKIATVTSKGTIKGIKKGTCYIYVYAQDGIYKSVKVTVK